jgi:hypothetical protein
MKTGVVTTFLTLCLISMANIANAEHWRTIEKSRYDWHADGKPYEFVLLAPDELDGGGDFTRFDIIRNGKVVFSLNDDSGLVKYSDALENVNKKLGKKSLISSKYLLVNPTIKSEFPFPLILLFGWAYESNPGALHVLALSDDGTPKEILSLRNFDVFAIKDLNNDSATEIIGKECSSQTWGNGFLTYDPYSVYRFGNSAISPMILDLKISESYNKKHYYGWAGIKCSEDIAVVLHPPGGGGPVLMDAEKAKKLLSK